MVACSATALALTACSSTKSTTSQAGTSGGTTSASALPSNINVLVTGDVTGVSALGLHYQRAGITLAMNEINDQKYLGDTKFSLTVQDTATTAATAASLISQAAANPKVTVVFGPVTSSEDAAQSPIAQKAKLPIIFQGPGPGVITGDYTFADATPQASTFPLGLKYLQSKGVKTVSVLWGNWSGVYNTMQQEITDGESTYGYKVLSNTGLPQTTTDFTAGVSKIIADKPDAAIVINAGLQSDTVISGLRQGGYKGLILGSGSLSSGGIKAAGANGVGVVWPIDFAVSSSAASTQAFVAAYKAANNEVPATWAAQAYDGMWWLARAIKASGSATREGIQKGLAMVAQTTYDGAPGTVKFKGNNINVNGVLVQWDGTNEVPIG